MKSEDIIRRRLIEAQDELRRVLEQLDEACHEALRIPVGASIRIEARYDFPLLMSNVTSLYGEVTALDHALHEILATKRLTVVS